jgi:hypothetical protein
MVLIKSAENHGFIRPLNENLRMRQRSSTSRIQVKLGLAIVESQKASPQSIFDYSMRMKKPSKVKSTKSAGIGMKSPKICELDQLLTIARHYKYREVRF